MIDIAEDDALAGLVNDEPDVATRAHRPEILVTRLVDAMEGLALADRVHLQFERRHLCRLLRLVIESGERGLEGVGDQELHPSYGAPISESSSSSLISPVSGFHSAQDHSWPVG
jgi:hypothetical protein